MIFNPALWFLHNVCQYELCFYDLTYVSSRLELPILEKFEVQDCGNVDDLIALIKRKMIKPPVIIRNKTALPRPVMALEYCKSQSKINKAMG